MAAGSAPGPGPGPGSGGGGGWAHTRTALRRLESRLACSRCHKILREPVCLGGCEHIFCSACVVDCIGAECPVCHTPTWIQDVQINRQLANTIQLFSKLQSLLNNIEPAEENTSGPRSPEQEEGTKKKSIKMWFSPRSKKVRYVLNKTSVPKQPQPSLSVGRVDKDTADSYEFICSPPLKTSSKKVTKRTPRSKKKQEKKSLAEVNEAWTLEMNNSKEGNETMQETQEEFKEKTVSFCSPPFVICSPELSHNVEALGAVTEADTIESGSEVALPLLDVEMDPSEQYRRKEIMSPVEKLDNSCMSEDSLPQRNEITPGKRERQLHSSVTTPIPKRLKKNKQNPDRDSFSQDVCAENLPSRVPKTKVHSSSPPPPQLATGDLSPKSRIDSVLSEFSGSPLSRTPCSPSPSSFTSCHPSIGSSPYGIKMSPNSITNVKRNHKGETLLHIASIKGDISSVENLLENGTDPNVKDHAGWTPLHEACNHGHKKVVELLLQHNALVNTTGYQNDSPLHDAVKNGHVSIVKLLLTHGASRDVVNIFGRRPVDYAETENMKSVLQLPKQNESSSTSKSSTVSPSQRKNYPLVLMGSGLTSSQQELLNDLAVILKAKRCVEFNSSVSHIIVPGDTVQRTIKCMLGILSGCWILKFEWVKACLESRICEQEESFEISDGPQRSRLNREQLLPKLFDGCYFYFLGTFHHPPKENLIELVRAAGGQILNRQPKPDSDVTQTINTVAYHAEPNSDQQFCTQYIIYDVFSKYRPEKIRQGKVWTATSSWFLDCLLSFQLLPVPN
uniref:BRCA1-associated RING domain protein 1 n=2 Tax=Ornithorhynchus anatinus TaxID=9258 RepID=A0A6I8PAG1_ORNAN